MRRSHRNLLIKLLQSGFDDKHLIVERSLQNGLCRCLDAQCFAGKPQVLFDRCRGQSHQKCDVLRCLAITHPFQGLTLPFRETSVGRIIGKRQDLQMRDICMPLPKRGSWNWRRRSRTAINLAKNLSHRKRKPSG